LTVLVLIPYPVTLLYLVEQFVFPGLVLEWKVFF